MQFTTFEFIVFFPIVVLCFYMIPKKARELWLLLASYYFYMGWNVQYAFLIFTSTVVTYLCARLFYHFRDEQKGRKKFVFICGLVINLAILIFFKYFYFLHDSVASVMSLFGVTVKECRLDIILPVGISFYTFQALGYMIDVYRGDIKPEKNFIRYALFVSFFPQLVAGPIERSGNLLRQLKDIPNKCSWNFDKVTRGLLMMVWGFFMKLVIADRAAILVDQVFELYYAFDGVALFMAMVLFAVQLYCDFASYSSIARGAASVLGIDLMQNFAAPFFSKSIAEVWRRWHISLSTWLRDYIYIPLGGSRCSKVKHYRNTMITFTISGLWHGASWHFVFWGMLQGIMIVMGNILKPIKEKCLKSCHIQTHTFAYQMMQVITTFGLFCLSFVFFRVETIKDGFYYIQRMFTRFDFWSISSGNIFHMGLDEKEMKVLLIGMIVLFLVDWFYEKRKVYFDSLIKGQSLIIQYIFVIAMILSIFIFGVYGSGYDATQFIYFQF